MNKIITLTPNQNSLSGKFRTGDVVLVKCDATTRAFSVQVPDAKTARDVIFYFKKIDSSTNVVTLTTLHTQTIDGENTKTLSIQNEVTGVVSNNDNYNLLDWVFADATFSSLTLSGLTSGSVIFSGLNGLISEDNSNLFWDNTNKRLGVGIGSGLNAKLHAVDSITNESGKHGLWSQITSNTTNDGTYNNYGLFAQAFSNPDSGKTNSGSVQAADTSCQHTGAGNTNAIVGYNTIFGGASGSSGIITNATGIRITPLKYNTTTTNLRSIWILEKQGAGAITNEYCIYSEQTSPARFVYDIQIAADGRKLLLGAGNDAGIDWSGSNMRLFANLVSSGRFQFFGSHLELRANDQKIYFGVNQKSSIYNDGVDFVLDSQENSSGDIVMQPNGGNVKLNGITSTGNHYPITDDTYYLGKNDDDSPFAWKGLILKDQAGTGKYYRLEVSGDALQITDLTD